MLHRIIVCAGGLALAGFLAAPAAATLYRCDGADGIPMFQAVPCAGDPVPPLQLPALNTLGDPLRATERALLRQEGGAGARPARRKASADPVQDRRQAERCLRARQQHEAVQAQLRRGYQPAQGERLRRRRDAHAEYLHDFCD